MANLQPKSGGLESLGEAILRLRGGRVLQRVKHRWLPEDSPWCPGGQPSVDPSTGAVPDSSKEHFDSGSVQEEILGLPVSVELPASRQENAGMLLSLHILNFPV